MASSCAGGYASDHLVLTLSCSSRDSALMIAVLKLTVPKGTNCRIESSMHTTSFLSPSMRHLVMGAGTGVRRLARYE